MRLYLRAFEIEDYKLLSKWRHDPEIGDLLCGNRYMVSSERERKWVESKIFDDSKDIYFAICLKENDQMIGYECIIKIDLRNRKAEWGGVTIGEKPLWGKGYASEAAKMLLHYAFYELPIYKLQGCCLPEHHVTQKMLLSLGFHRDGVLRSEVFRGGEFKDFFLYSLLRDEYLSIDSNRIDE